MVQEVLERGAMWGSVLHAHGTHNIQNKNQYFRSHFQLIVSASTRPIFPSLSCRRSLFLFFTLPLTWVKIKWCFLMRDTIVNNSLKWTGDTITALLQEFDSNHMRCRVLNGSSDQFSRDLPTIAAPVSYWVTIHISDKTQKGSIIYTTGNFHRLFSDPEVTILLSSIFREQTFTD